MNHVFICTVLISLIAACFIHADAFLGISQQKVKPTMGCPDGFKLNGETCEANDDDHSDKSGIKCPPGTVYSYGNCISGQAPSIVIIPKCPPGTKHSNGNCVYENTNIECPSGFKQVNGRCEHEDSRCPSGYREENGACVQITHPTIACPYGQVLIAGICQPEKTQICPPGFKPYLNTCIPDSTAPPIQTICPPGFKPYYSVCIQETTQQSTNIGCPLNYVLTGGFCPPAYSNPCPTRSSYPFIQTPCYGDSNSRARTGEAYSGFFKK